MNNFQRTESYDRPNNEIQNEDLFRKVTGKEPYTGSLENTSEPLDKFNFEAVIDVTKTSRKPEVTKLAGIFKKIIET